MRLLILIPPFVTDTIPQAPPLDVAYIAGALRSEELIEKLRVADLNIQLAFLLRASELDYAILNRLFGGLLYAIPGEYPLNMFLVDALPSYELLLVLDYLVNNDYNAELLLEYALRQAKILLINPVKIVYLLEIFLSLCKAIKNLIRGYDMLIFYATNTSSAVASIIMSSFIKSIDDIPIIGVGNVWAIPHIAKLSLEYGGIDIALYWGYEILIKNLIGIYNKGGDTKTNLDEVPNLIYKLQSNTIRHTNIETRIDMGALPYPDYSIFDLDSYKSLNEGIISLFLEGGRGCPYRCNFCINRKFFTQGSANDITLRFKSPDRILEEIKTIIKFNPDRIVFTDLTFNANRKWFNQILNLISKEKLNVDFGCNLRVDLISEEDISMLVKANFYKVILGIESFNASSVALYAKSSDPSYYVKAAMEYPIKMLHNNIIPQINQLFNHPYQDGVDEDLNALNSYVNRLKSEGLPVFEIYSSTTYIPWGSDIYIDLIIRKRKHVNIIYISIPDYLTNIVNKIRKASYTLSYLTTLPYAIKLPYEIQSNYAKTKTDIHRYVYSLWSQPHEIALYLSRRPSKSVKKAYQDLITIRELEEDRFILYSLILSKYLKWVPYEY